MHERKDGDQDYKGEDMGRVPPSNAYQRRVAGGDQQPLQFAELLALLIS